MENTVLKNYDKELTMIILINIGVLIYSYNINASLFELLKETKFILPYFISLLTPLIITNIIPNRWKLLFVGYFEQLDESNMYSFIKNIFPDKYEKDLEKFLFLPGYSIFYRLSHNQIKNTLIKKKVLKSKYGDFPTDNIKQNKLWYHIYRENESNPRIFPNHRYFLLMRDTVCINIILIVVINLFYLMQTGAISVNWSIFMIIEIIVEIIMCRKYCNKYVESVLVEETYQIENKKINTACNIYGT